MRTAGHMRAALADRYAVATANKHLAALRGVLKEALRLELMTAEDNHRAADLSGISQSTLPRGRHVEHGEITALARVCRGRARSRCRCCGGSPG